MGKLDVEGVLAKNSWFASLPAELSESILHAGRIRYFESSLIYSADDTADGLFALVSGQIRLMRTSATGQLAFLAIASPGAWFGVSGALDGRPHAYDAIAIGETAVFHLSQEKMTQVIGGRIEHHAAFVRLLCHHYRVAVGYVCALRTHPPIQVLAHELIRMASRHGQRIESGVRIDLRLSQEDWAAMVGVGRQTINRLLKKLEEKGIASVNYASITIHRMDALEDLVANKTAQISEFSLPHPVSSPAHNQKLLRTK
jgi:CRP/FNR family transcriptional regulator, cyclic AMP receptor protein